METTEAATTQEYFPEVQLFDKYQQIWKSYNSASLKVRSSNFCMVVNLDNTHIL